MNETVTRTFPSELASLRQWICWRLEPDPKGGKDRKIPYDPKTGSKASSVDPRTWTSLDEALAMKDRYQFTGLGFVFTHECGIVGIDIDHCHDIETGKPNETATDILRHTHTYTEISPSGTGLHLFLRGRIPEGGNKNSRTGVEMYAHSRYFTMTGQKLEGAPIVIPEDNEALQWIHEHYIKAQKKEKPVVQKAKARKPVQLSDADLLGKAMKNEDFKTLWEGRWQEGYPTQSEADYALCCKLAFWTGKDVTQMDRLFRQSGLMRGKWDDRHHSSGAAYGAETLGKAAAAVTDVYTAKAASAIFLSDGRYCRAKDEKVYPLTNFTVRPLEMITSSDDTQMTADLITVRNEVFRQVFMSSDFSSLQKFKNLLNKHTISLSYTGTEGDLELLKGFISDMEWERKTGVKALGMYEHNGQWVYVSPEGAVASGGRAVTDIVQLERHRSISSVILGSPRIMPDALKEIGITLLGYNEPAKTVPILAWCSGCFLKEHLRKTDIRFPHLFLVGEQGSGKSNTLEKAVLPIFGRSKVYAATQVTAFTLMKDAASSNIIPQALDEFKPSKTDRNKLSVLYNHMRDLYDGHEGVRGRMDQSTVTYELLAPLAVAGEESPDEPAIRERSLELLFSRKDLKDNDCRKHFGMLSRSRDILTALGRGLLEAALGTTAAEAEGWYQEAMASFDGNLPARVSNNLACCAAGLRLIERLCGICALQWAQVFSLPLPVCDRYLYVAARDYLLDGSTHNKGVLEESLSIMSRMGMDPRSEWTLLDNGAQVAIRFTKVYDRFTMYRRDHAITGECLDYNQFLKQLRRSDLFVEYKQVRFAGMTAKAHVLDFTLLKERCDINSFGYTDYSNAP